jgi:hypothetical protein
MLKFIKIFWFVFVAEWFEYIAFKLGAIKMVTVTDIVTEYGAYYLNSGQNMNRILKMLTQDEETTKIMTPIKTDETVYQLAKGSVTKILQPFQKAYTAKGTLTFTPKPIYLKHMKMDFDEDPDDIEGNWLGFLASESLARQEWPLVRYMIEKYLIPQLREDFELDAAFYGVAANPTPGVAGDPVDVIDGIQRLLQLGVADGTINQVTGLGAFDVNTIHDQIEAFVAGVSQRYKRVPMNICVAPEWLEAYLKDKRSLGYYQITGPNQINANIDFTPHQVIGLPSMIGSGVVWATPKSNIIHLTKKSINKNRVRVEESKRELAIMTDWWEGFGFGINEIVWTNSGASSGSGSV